MAGVPVSEQSMVVAVARAMAPSCWADFDANIHGSRPNYDMAQTLWMEKARAAITAMRETSNRMNEAGWQFAETRDAILGNGEVAEMWSTMIDAALNQ